MSWLAVEGLRKTFSEDVIALDDLSFALEKGEFFCVVGPTNAGKSTLLKTIAGLHRPDRGRILIAGHEVTDLQPRDRHVSLLFQNVALFPTLTGFDNIAFPLRTAGVPAEESARRVEEVAEMLKVGHVLGRLPRTFSGGEQQRVAIGRAIARPSQVLLLDEPLTNLDARIRITLRIEFKALHRGTGQTILYVTHDQVEAMSLSDRIAVLHEGRFQQIGTPDEIYHRPANRFVAGFVGTPPMNILAAELSGEAGDLRLRGPGFELPIAGTERLQSAASLPRALAIGVRPEALLVAPERSADTPIAGEVTWVERLGSRHVLDVRLGGTLVKAVVRPDHPVRGEGPAWFGFAPRAEHLLDRDSGIFFR
ncbi:MAG: ABC transporter ATP-binding protein [Kiloniellales bacterium]